VVAVSGIGFLRKLAQELEERWRLANEKPISG
jgi:hypothetical protein